MTPGKSPAGIVVITPFSPRNAKPAARPPPVSSRRTGTSEGLSRTLSTRNNPDAEAAYGPASPVKSFRAIVKVSALALYSNTPPSAWAARIVAPFGLATSTVFMFTVFW